MIVTSHKTNPVARRLSSQGVDCSCVFGGGRRAFWAAPQRADASPIIIVMSLLWWLLLHLLPFHLRLRLRLLHLRHRTTMCTLCVRRSSLRPGLAGAETSTLGLRSGPVLLEVQFIGSKARPVRWTPSARRRCPTAGPAICTRPNSRTAGNCPCALTCRFEVERRRMCGASVPPCCDWQSHEHANPVIPGIFYNFAIFMALANQ